MALPDSNTSLRWVYTERDSERGLRRWSK